MALVGGSVPHHADLSIKLPGVLMTWPLASPRAGDPREDPREGKSSREAAMSFMK